MLRQSCALLLLVACTPVEPLRAASTPLPDEAYGMPTAVMADPEPEAEPAPKTAVVAVGASSEFQVAGNVAKAYGEDAPTPSVRSVPLGVKLTVKWTAPESDAA